MEAIAHEAALRGRQNFGATIELKLRVSAAHAVPLPLAAQQYENERSLWEMAFVRRQPKCRSEPWKTDSLPVISAAA